MKSASTISKINRELISAFARLDTWFDEVPDRDNHWEAIRVADHILNSNHHLLKAISTGFENALSDSSGGAEEDDANQSIDQLRTSLREQLYFCLCLLDELETQNATGRETEEKGMDIHEQLYSITQHVSYHLERMQEPTFNAKHQ